MLEVSEKLPVILLLTFCLTLFLSSVTYALDGNFTIDLSLQPQTTTTEASLMNFDLESNLQLGFAFSGLSLSSDFGFGLAGTEFFIFTLRSTLGGLDLSNQFVFASPFNKNGLGLGGESSILFVKKRVELKTCFAGLKIKDELFYEDVTFPDPSSSLRTQVYIQDDQTFNFGNIITIRGNTIGGIPVTSILGICADPQEYNRIKKRTFRGEACRYQNIDGFVEKIIIGAVDLLNTSWKSETIFRQLEPIEEIIVGEFNLYNFVDLKLELNTTDITSLDFEQYLFNITSQWFNSCIEWNSEFEETWYWIDVPFSYGALDFDWQAAFTKGEGLTDMLLEGIIGWGSNTNFGILAVYSNGQPAGLEFLRFSLNSRLNNLIMGAKALFTTQTLEEAHFRIGLEF